MAIIPKRQDSASVEFKSYARAQLQSAFEDLARKEKRGLLEAHALPDPCGPEPVTPLNDLRAAISAAIDENLPDPPHFWRKSIFNLARALHGLGDLRARWMRGEEEPFREIVEEYFERAGLDELNYEPETVWDYFEQVAMARVKYPKGQEGARWQSAWDRALQAYLGRKPDALAGSIIKEKRYKSPALKLAVHFVVELQRGRKIDERRYDSFMLSSYQLADQLATQLGNFPQPYAYRLLAKLVRDGVLEITARGAGGTMCRKANEYRLVGL